MIRALSFALLPLFLSSFSLAAPPTSGTATFENYAEGFHTTQPFTDPLSGITFAFPTGNQNLVIEYAGADPYSSVFSFTHYASSNGYTPGDGFGLGSFFDFTATFPAPVQHVSLDVFGNIFEPQNPTVTLAGFDASGNLLATSVWHLPNALWQTTSLSLDSPSSNIAYITYATSATAFSGIDNLHYESSPEPTSIVLLAPVTLLLTRRRFPGRSLSLPHRA